MKDINLIIANNIRQLRKANKMTQYEMAEKLNYSNKTISRWESGEIIPDVLTLNKICELFNVQLTQIFEENISNKEIKKYYNLQIGTKLAISLLAVLSIWIIATVIFVGQIIVNNIIYWQLFICVIPVSCIIGIIFNSIWGKVMFNYVLISILNWTALLSTYICIGNYKLYVIFLIGIPIQIAIILWSNITKNNIIKKNKKDLDNQDF